MKETTFEYIIPDRHEYQVKFSEKEREELKNKVIQKKKKNLMLKEVNVMTFRF